jgi:orotidine-5'-phosphate decarboxylase
MTFLQRLDRAAERNKSLLCIGLDVDIQKIPKHLLGRENPVLEFNKQIITATCDLVCCYKFNLAFYEVMGERAWYTIHQSLARIPFNIPSIGDGKRGDIGNTTDLYARSIYDDYDFHATTASPYMGRDSVEPFLSREGRCTFFLALTSNKGSRDFQYLTVDGRPLYRTVVDTVKRWDKNGSCGLVVGATHPSELADVRRDVGSMPILIPGLGAQGGDVEQSVKAGVDADGRRAIFNASRSVIYASGGEDFADAARAEAIRMRDEINTYR